MNPVSGKYKSDGPDEIWEVEFTIAYTNFDHEQNWTQRTFKGESVSRYMNEVNDLDDCHYPMFHHVDYLLDPDVFLQIGDKP